MHTRSTLDHWRDRRELDEPGYRRALQALALVPDAARWRVHVERLLLITGVLSLLAGAVMVFASNWLTWPRLARVAVVEAGWLALLAWTWLSWGRRSDAPSGRWALFAVATGTGICLAVIGQAYQTGADAWQLFALWALLALPWALLGRFMPLWGLWIVLASSAIALSAPRWPWQRGLHVFGLFDGFNLPLIVFWILALCVAEYCVRGVHDWRARVLPRLLALAISVPLTLSACLVAAGEHVRVLGPAMFDQNGLIVLLWLLCAGGGGAYAYYRGRDLFVLALALFSAWSMGIALMFMRHHAEDLLMLIAAYAVAGLGGIGWWLTVLHRRWQEDDAHSGLTQEGGHD